MRKVYIIHDDYFLIKDLKKEKNSENICFIEFPLKKVSFFKKIIRKLHFQVNFPLKKIWFDKEKIKRYIFEKEDIIIFFDCTNIKYIKLLEKEISGIQKIFWLWNKETEKKIKEIKTITDNIWTFDKKDSILYNLNYTPQFYWRRTKTNKRNKSKIDIFFVGINKGRLKIIYNFDKKIKGIKKLYILKNKFSIKDFICSFFMKYKEYMINKELEYEKVLELINESKCLLEINKKNQEGITLRTLEAIFFNKKLITNNKKIKEYDFYNSKNIYILEDEEVLEKESKKIEKFLNEENEKIKNKILENYTFESWIKNILKDTIGKGE